MTFLLMVFGPITLFILLIVLPVARYQKRKQREYQQALRELAQNPDDMNLKRQVFHAGRIHYAEQQSRGARIGDIENRIQNDIHLMTGR